MSNTEDEVIDSQINAENVGFLDSCFDNSFTLQSSILTVKEYVSEEHKDNNVSRKLKSVTSNLVASFNTSICKQSQLEQILKNETSKQLKVWGLPIEISKKYKERGIIEMFEWQASCLSNSKVLLDCCNLVYSAPTSAGKTLVADILTIKTVLERQKKVIIILPFVSIVREKMFYLQDILTSSGIRVEGFMGSQSPPGGLQAVHIAICTIEKANSLVNKLLDEDTISDLGAVIVDELHLLGDPHRGYILELLLTKIKYVSSKFEGVQIQIVGMSATLPNLEVLASWLNAELFVTQFRPIPLEEYCLVGKMFYDKSGNHVNFLEDKKLSLLRNDHVLQICLDTIQNGCSVLIFCMTKNRCENLAQNLSLAFYKLGCSGDEVASVLRKELKPDRISEVLEQLKSCPVGLDDVLKNSISFGVAYHHAGLTFDERDIIEGAFKSGAIRVLVATSTLSSGVNLPARKVIIRSPVFQNQPIDIRTYKQMIGRAGRMGKDSKGESILICTEAEKNIGFNLMMGALEPVKSCIESEDKFMRAVLEMIASEVACTTEELELYCQCTLLYIQKEISLSHNSLLKNTLTELEHFELIRVQNEENGKKYIATSLGKACLSSSMAPNDGLSLFCELQKARQCLVLETDLHLIYLVTPYSVSSQWGNIDWLHLLTLWESLTKAMKRVGELVGIQERFIVRCVRGTNKMSDAQNKMNVHKRFYTALALQDLVNEVPLSKVAAKFQCSRGFLQSLQQAAATFAGMVTVFCHQLGWKSMEMLIGQFQDRLHFGIHSDLLELMKLPSLNGLRARSLFNCGMETVAAVASTDVVSVENALLKAVPFQSEKKREDDDNCDIRKRNKMKNVWITGCCGMTTREAAENLILEARQYLENEIGGVDIKWNAKKSSKSKQNIEFTESNSSNSKSDVNSIPLNYNEIKLININEIDNQTALNTKDNTFSIKCNIEGNKLSQEIHCRNSKDPYIQGQNKLSTCSLKSNELSQEIDCKNIKEPNKNEQGQALTSPINEDMGPMRHISNEVTKSQTQYTSTLCDIYITPEVNIDRNHKSFQQPFDVMAFNFVTKKTENSPASKDDLLWDSLNFTETAFNNVTQNILEAKEFSPELSFNRDYETKVDEDCEKLTFKSMSTNSNKDISLFSSDGDNSSLFEDSLPLDSLSSRLLENKTVDNCVSEENLITDTFNVNSDTILKAFESTISNLEEDEDIKLVYDDDNKGSSPEKTNDASSPEAKGKIHTEYLLTQSKLKRSKQENHTGKTLLKKLKLDNTLYDCKENSTVYTKCIKPKILSEKSDKLMLKMSEFELECFILREHDIIKNIPVLNKIKVASLFLCIRKKTRGVCSEIIGHNILKLSDNAINYNDNMIQGIAIYFGLNTICYLDLNSLDSTSSDFPKILHWLERKDLNLRLFSIKSVSFYLLKHLQLELSASFFDICLADWLVNSDEKEPSLSFLTNKYCNVDLVSIKKQNNLQESCINAWAIWKVAEKQQYLLSTKYQLTREILDIEIQVAMILARCEYNGLSVDKSLASTLLIDVKNCQEIIKQKANKICGYHFNLNSSKDVAKVLGIYRGRNISTKKSVLSTHNSAISSAIIYWRKLNSILTKTLYPLTEKAWVHSEDNKIYPTYTMFTCTGRVSMHEPNLQNVPRTFSIPASYLGDANSSYKDVTEFNCRNIFKASAGSILVSADYCQLEMRILTHYCGDEVLTKIMHSNVDVFRSIAASWSCIPEEDVDDDLRQKAKQLCYGIIYGMGNRTLGQMLDVTEIEAAMFMDTFHKTYPSIKVFTSSVVQRCRERGFIETLMKRRRYLPDINSTLITKRSTAERQAVNTTIQGSAADIAKAAMCEIDARLRPIEEQQRPRLILQMHDELIYEVPESNKQNFISILKDVMENTVKLNVPLPVKVKTGPTWGSLIEYT